MAECLDEIVLLVDGSNSVVSVNSAIKRVTGIPVSGCLPAEVTITDRLADPDLRAKVVIFRPLEGTGVLGRLPSNL